MNCGQRTVQRKKGSRVTISERLIGVSPSPLTTSPVGSTTRPALTAVSLRNLIFLKISSHSLTSCAYCKQYGSAKAHAKRSHTSNRHERKTCRPVQSHERIWTCKAWSKMRQNNVECVIEHSFCHARPAVRALTGCSPHTAHL